MRKELGKIQSAELGFNEYLFGLWMTFGSDGWGVSWNESVNHSDRCKWDSELEKLSHYLQMCKKVEQTLLDAKVRHVSELRGKPVECTFEGNILKSWRILTEVL